MFQDNQGPASGTGSPPVATTTGDGEVPPIADSHCVLGIVRTASDGDFQKKYRRINPAHAAGVWPSRNKALGDRWEHWRDEKLTLPSRHRYEECVVRDHVALAGQLNELAPNRFASLVVGRLKPELQTGNSISAAQTANYDDVPSKWLIFDYDDVVTTEIDPGSDLDEVLCSRDAFEAFSDKLITKTLPPEFQRVSYVASVTSSTGFVGAERINLRLFFRLAEPLCLADQRNSVERLNALMQDRGLPKYLDASIYGAGHLIFTALPEASVHLMHEGNVRQGVVKGRLFREAIAVERDDDDVEIPAAYLQPLHAVSARDSHDGLRKSLAVSEGSQFAPGKGWEFYLSQLREGHVNRSLYQAAASYCRLTPREEWDAAFLLSRFHWWAEQKNLNVKKDAQRTGYFTIQWIDKEFQRCEAKGYTKENAGRLGRVVDAPPRPEGLEVGDVRTKIKVAAEESGAKAIAYEEGDGVLTPHALFKTPAGSGKTHAAVAALDAETLANQRVFYLAPTRDLGGETVRMLQERLPDASLARQHHGRDFLCERAIAEANNPDKAKQYRKLAIEVERAGLQPLKVVCPGCPLYDVCGAPQQALDDGPGFIGLQHAHATTSLRRLKPDSAKAPAFSIVDEDLIRSLLAADEDETNQPVASLRPKGDFGIIGSAEGTRVGATTDFRAARDQLCQMLEADTGPPKRVELAWFSENMTITQPDGVFEFKRRTKLAIESEWHHQSWLVSEYRKTTDDEESTSAAKNKARKRQSAGRRERNKRRKGIKEALRASRFALEIYRAIDENLEIAARDEMLGLFRRQEQGEPWVYCHPRKQLPAVLRDGPVQWLDGTASSALFRSMLRGADVEITEYDWPMKLGAYQLVQYADRPFSQRMLTEAEGKNANANIRKIHQFILSKAYDPALKSREHKCTVDGVKKDLVVICQKSVKKKLNKLGLPLNVATAHFNNLRGLNRFREVPCGIIIGRPEPKAIQAEALAGAWFRNDPNVISLSRMADWVATHGNDARYKGERVLRMADGTAVAIPCEAHPDEHVEAMREHLVNNEVRQAIARLRLYDRTEANAAEIYVFGDVDTRLPVHELRRWEEADLSVVDVMAAAGVVFTSAGSAQKAYPEAFSRLAPRTAKAALAVLRADQKCKVPIKKVYIGSLHNCPPPDWRVVKFRPLGKTRDGRRAYAQTALMDCARHPDPGKALEAALGCAVEWWGAEDTRKDAEGCPAAPARPRAECLASSKRRGRPRTSASKGSRGRSQVRRCPSALASGNDGQAPSPTERASSAK